MESSAVNEHQSNGVVERAAQTVGGMVRTHKLALEEAYQREVEADHVAIPRLILHVGMMISLLEVEQRRPHNLRAIAWEKVRQGVAHLRGVRVLPPAGACARSSEQVGGEVSPKHLPRTAVGDERDVHWHQEWSGASCGDQEAD